MSNGEQIVQFIAQGIQQGASKEQVVQALQQKGVNPEQAAQMYDQVKAQLDKQGGGEGGGQQGRITAEQAIEAFKESGLPPAAIVRTIQILMEMSPDEIQKLLSMLEQGGKAQQEAQQREPEPGQENY